MLGLPPNWRTRIDTSVISAVEFEWPGWRPVVKPAAARVSAPRVSAARVSATRERTGLGIYGRAPRRATRAVRDSTPSSDA